MYQYFVTSKSVLYLSVLHYRSWPLLTPVPILTHMLAPSFTRFTSKLYESRRNCKKSISSMTIPKVFVRYRLSLEYILSLPLIRLHYSNENKDLSRLIKISVEFIPFFTFPLLARLWEKMSMAYNQRKSSSRYNPSPFPNIRYIPQFTRLQPELGYDP